MRKLIEYIKALFRIQNFYTENPNSPLPDRERIRQIGKRAKGINFREYVRAPIIGWSEEMERCVNEIGEIVGYSEDTMSYEIYFYEQERIWHYPAEIVPIEHETRGKRGCTIKK